VNVKERDLKLRWLNAKANLAVMESDGKDKKKVGKTYTDRRRKRQAKRHVERGNGWWICVTCFVLFLSFPKSVLLLSTLPISLHFSSNKTGRSGCRWVGEMKIYSRILSDHKWSDIAENKQTKSDLCV